MYVMYVVPYYENRKLWINIVVFRDKIKYGQVWRHVLYNTEYTWN